MAVLSDSERVLAYRSFTDDVSPSHTELALTKNDLRAAVNAIDQWVDTNSTAFNTAIPQPARGILTAKQKAQLLLYVVRRRFEVS